MTHASSGPEIGPGQILPHLVAADERLSTIETQLRAQLGSRRAHLAVVGMALLSARPGGKWLDTGVTDRLTPTEALHDVDPDLGRALDALDVRTVFQDLYRTGDLGRIAWKVLTVIGNLNEADRRTITEQLLKRTADPSIGLFSVPIEIADLASRLALEITEDTDAEAFNDRELRIFDPRIGCGEMLLELARHVTSHRGKANAAGYEPSAEALSIAQATINLAGYPVSNLHQGEWLLQPIDREQGFDYLVSAIPATPWRHLDYELEYTLALPARPRSTDSSLLYVARVAQWISKLPNSRAVLVVNSAALTTGAAGSGDVQLRRLIAELGTLRAVIALPPRIFERTAVAPTVLLFTGLIHGVVRDGFRLVDARKLGGLVDRKRRFLSSTDISDIVLATL